MHIGGALRTVRAAAQPAPHSFTSLHGELMDEFRNASHWPKHVLVRYRWREAGVADEAGGLYAVLLLGAHCDASASGFTMRIPNALRAQGSHWRRGLWRGRHLIVRGR